MLRGRARFLREPLEGLSPLCARVSDVDGAPQPARKHTGLHGRIVSSARLHFCGLYLLARRLKADTARFGSTTCSLFR